MSLLSMGAQSSADKETRILRLKAYINTEKVYRSDVALKTAGLYSWTTMISYLKTIQKKYSDTLTDLGKSNFEIAMREAKLLESVKKKSRKR